MDHTKTREMDHTISTGDNLDGLLSISTNLVSKQLAKFYMYDKPQTAPLFTRIVSFLY